jgi:hypothetical protein
VRWPDTVINILGRVWASHVARGPARHDPLAHPGRIDMVPIRVGSSRARAGPARLTHLDMYSHHCDTSNT